MYNFQLPYKNWDTIYLKSNLAQAEDLFNSLLQRAFKGELV